MKAILGACINPALNHRFFGDGAAMAVTGERERFERLAVDEWADAARFNDWQHAAAVMYAVCRVCDDIRVISDASMLGQIAHMTSLGGIGQTTRGQT